MPRAPRMEYEGGVYHVMSRGNRRELIYWDDSDRKMFLRTLEEAVVRSGFRIYSYVLMGNHYHLLLETPEANLVEGMRWLQSTYTARFNARHRQAGHLFQGRYKAIPVDPEEGTYLRDVSDYIHLNPARAGMLNSGSPLLKSYQWSSFPAICRGKMPQWLKGENVMSWHQFSIGSGRERAEYGRQLQNRAEECRQEESGDKEKDQMLKAIRRGWYLGGELFREKLEDLVSRLATGKKRQSYEGEALRKHDQRQAEELLKRGLQALALELEEIRILKNTDPRKQGLAWLVKSQTVAPNDWLQQKLQMGHRSNITRAVSRFRNAKDRDVRRLKKLLHLCPD